MLDAPLRTPFKTALRAVNAVEDVVVLIETDDGRVGHGSAPATAAITGETHESIIAAIQSRIGPCLMGVDVADFEAATTRVQLSVQGNGSAKAAIDIALHDLSGQLRSQPLCHMLGGAPVELWTDITISVDTVDKMVADSLDALQRGFRALKVKIGTDLRTDIERVKAVYEAVGTTARIRLDANQGWTPEQAVQAIRELEDAGVALELIEQPVKAHDLAGLKFVTERVHAPVMADESVFGPEQALELIRLRAADIINIKLMKAGGIGNALRIADLAGEHGVECMIGCMLESSIGVAAAAHVAAARPGVITRVDLDVPSLCTRDPVQCGVTFDGPRISISESPGLGVVAVHGLRPIAGGNYATTGA